MHRTLICECKMDPLRYAPSSIVRFEGELTDHWTITKSLDNNQILVTYVSAFWFCFLNGLEIYWENYPKPLCRLVGVQFTCEHF